MAAVAPRVARKKLDVLVRALVERREQARHFPELGGERLLLLIAPRLTDATERVVQTRHAVQQFLVERV